MSITEQSMAYGAWSITLRGEEAEDVDGSPLPATPQEILDLFDEDGFLGHVLITPQWHDPNEVAPLPIARYSGVLRETSFSQEGVELSGAGMVYWLGDTEQRGPIFENTLSINNDTFVNGITAILPDAITAGNIIAEVGTQSASFLYITARSALEYWLSLYGAEYEITPQGTINAGTPASLFSTFNAPTTLIKRKGAGSDPTLKHLPLSNARFDADMVNFATRVIALTQVEDQAFLEGQADLPIPTTRRDIHGNLVAITDVNVETSSLATNADARAAARLAQIGEPRQALDLSTDDYDVDGTVKVGDSAWVYDPAAGLVDLTNQIEFRGEIYFPIKLRIVGLTWPVTKEMGVFFRQNDSAGTITDLTPYVEFEQNNSTQVVVDKFTRNLAPRSSEPIGPIVSPEVNPNAAPSQPSAPSVSATDQILHIVVSHDLTKAAGGSLESWTAFLKVFASTTSGFTPGPTNFIGRIEVTSAQITLGTPVIGVFELDNALEHFFKVQPIGTTGLEGPASAQASATANLIPSVAIISLVADKITAGTITASIEMTAAIITGGLIRTAVSGNRLEIAGADPDRIDWFTGEVGEISGASIQVFDSLMRIVSPEFVQDEFVNLDLVGSGGPGGLTTPKLQLSGGPAAVWDLDVFVQSNLFDVRAGGGSSQAGVVIDADTVDLWTDGTAQRLFMDAGTVQLFADSGAQKLTLGTDDAALVAGRDITATAGRNISLSSTSATGVVDIGTDSFNQRLILDGDDSRLFSNRNVLLVADNIVGFHIGGVSRMDITSSGTSIRPDGNESLLIQNFQVVCQEDFKLAGNVLYLGGSGDPNLQEYNSSSARFRAGDNKLRIGNFVSGADMTNNAEDTPTEFTAVINDVSDFALKDIDAGPPPRKTNRGLVRAAAESLALGRFKGRATPPRLMVDAAKMPAWVQSEIHLHHDVPEGADEKAVRAAPTRAYKSFSNSSVHAWHIQSLDELYERMEAVERILNIQGEAE